MSDNLPSGWTQKESKSHPGKVYYINSFSGETTWDKPTSPAIDTGSSVSEVQVLHILKKHNKSRRPSSWRVTEITQSKEEAILQIHDIRKILQKSSSAMELEKKFREIASTESDCSSAKNGGDLGMFGRGQMQKVFEDASFALPVGGLSDIVDSDSGIHIILRIQ
jgi:NIMA-interacting peptidyl-prolyl cis-trans isomerase 1